MTAEAGRNKKWLGYTGYFLLVTGLLFYYLFPERAVVEFFDDEISRIHQDLTFEAGKIRPWIPAGLRITTGSIHLNAMEQPLFIADSFYLGPQIVKYVGGEHRFNVKGRAYSGNIEGTLLLHNEGAPPIEGDLSLKDLMLDDYPVPLENFKQRLSGRLNGEIVYNNDDASRPGGGGRLELNLDKGQLQFEEPIFNIDSVDLRNISLEARLSRREVTIIKAELAGAEFVGSMSGSILLHRDIGLSQINVKGTLEPQAEFYRKYPELRELLKTMTKRVKRGQYFFAVTGTLDNPKFRLL